MGSMTLGRLKQLIREEATAMALSGPIARPSSAMPWELYWGDLVGGHSQLDYTQGGSKDKSKASITLETDPELIRMWVKKWTADEQGKYDYPYYRAVEVLQGMFPDLGLEADWGWEQEEREAARLQARGADQ